MIDPRPAPARPEASARLFGVLEDVIARRLAGETLSDDDVISRHGDLMPQLAEQLDQLRRVERARWSAAGSSNAATSPIERSVLPASAVALPGYQIVRELHRGGQGVVFLAIQKSTQRHVAIKVLREGPFAGGNDLARFEREVHILAQLRHPNIVAIHDSGLSPSGQYYFVMDYIAGHSLDEFLTAHPLPASASIRSALENHLHLFQRICEAVHAAHLRGVIHRDLKPSNIRVDEQGEPHVLDFGLARVSDDESVDESADNALTITGQFVGSLPWASPEQSQGAIEQIDLRTDVYSLGVILYQMLTGRFPYVVTGRIQTVIDNIQRADPVKPRSIASRLDADIETILLKCLAKEAPRRYQGAGDLATEIRRYRSGEAIEARRDHPLYLLRKSLRRHWVAACVAGAFLLTLAAGSGILLQLYRGKIHALDDAQRQTEKASAEARKAQRVVEFLRTMLKSADPNLARGREVTVRQVADKAAKDLGGELSDQPEVAASLHRTLGETYSALGEFSAAEKHFRSAVDLGTRATGAQHPDTLSAENGLASALEALNRYDEAETLFRSCLESTRRVTGTESKEALDVLHNLANLLSHRGKRDEAETLLKEGLDASVRRLGPENSDTLVTKKVLAELWQDQGRYDESEKALREVLEAQRRVMGNDSPQTLGTVQVLGMLLKAQGKLKDAEPFYREVIEGNTRILGNKHPDTLRARNSLGRLLAAEGKMADAESLYRETIALQTEALGEDHTDTLITTNNLALLLREKGRLAEAEPLARRVEEVGRRVLGDQHPDYLVWLNNLGSLLSAEGKSNEAENAYRRVVEGRRKALGSSHPATRMAEGNLALLLAEMSRFDEAEPLARTVVEARKASLGPDHPDTLLAMHNLSYLLLGKGQLEEAEQICRQALDARRRKLGENHPDVVQSMLNLGRILSAQGKQEEALSVLNQAAQITRDHLPPGHWYGPHIRIAIGQCLKEANQLDEAAAQILAGITDLQAAIGPRHPRLKKPMESLVSVYTAKGDSAKAADWKMKIEQLDRSQTP